MGVYKAAFRVPIALMKEAGEIEGWVAEIEDDMSQVIVFEESGNEVAVEKAQEVARALGLELYMVSLWENGVIKYSVFHR